MSQTYPDAPEPVVIPGQDPIEPSAPPEAPQPDVPPGIDDGDAPLEQPDRTPSPDQGGGRAVD